MAYNNRLQRTTRYAPRCRTCGADWAEACYSSGHMEIYYLFPAPPTGDSVRWLHEEAAGLLPS